MVKITSKHTQTNHPLERIKGEVENVFERLAENWHDFETSVSEHLPDWMPRFSKPKVNASESEDTLEFSVELPGLEPDDIDVSVHDGVLVIEAEKESESEEKQKNYYLRERSNQKYYRSFALPIDVKGDGVTANCKNGLLTIKIPRVRTKTAEVSKIKIESE